MGIVLGIGKILGKLALRLVMVGGVLYVEYRICGGPPIRKVYREVKKARKDDELKKRAEQAKKDGNIVYLNDFQVV